MDANALRLVQNTATNVALCDNANKRLEKMNSLLELIAGKFTSMQTQIDGLKLENIKLNGDIKTLKRENIELNGDIKTLKLQSKETRGELNALKLSLVSRQLASKVKNNGSTIGGAEKVRNKAGNIIDELHDIAHAKRVKVKNAHDLKIKAQRTLAVREAYKASGQKRPDNSFGKLETEGLRKRAQIINKKLVRRPGDSNVELKNYENMSDKSSAKTRETKRQNAALSGSKRPAKSANSTARTKGRHGK